MRVATKQLRIESHDFHYKVALYLGYVHIKFEDETERKSLRILRVIRLSVDAERRRTSFCFSFAFFSSPVIVSPLYGTLSKFCHTTWLRRQTNRCHADVVKYSPKILRGKNANFRRFFSAAHVHNTCILRKFATNNVF